MRWLYSDPTVETEVRFRQEKLAQIDAWWAAFQANENRLSDLFAGRDQWDLADWMTRHLGAIDERLMWEFGPAVSGGGHRLVITPEAHRFLRPLLNTLIEKAPALDGWEFFSYRIPCQNIGDVASVLDAKSGANVDEFSATATIGEFGKIDLVFYCQRFHDQPDHEDDIADALIATESTLGERTLDVWIGELHTSDGDKPSFIARLLGAVEGPPKDAVPLPQLKGCVDSLIAELAARCSELPLFRTLEEREWGTIRLQPPELDQHFGRTDLLLCVSGALDIWNVAHSSFIFDSSCFSNHGEIFCYLKIATPEGPTQENGQVRARIEDELTEMLVEKSLGCSIGGGAGDAHAYVDLALLDVERAIPPIRELLLRHGVDRSSWLLFFDDHLAEEWIGIYEDTPEPALQPQA
ncbi:MAG: hypothetical protein ACI9G1_004523 [Pirellulaceae bacterium]|jgi:hypothetical protein